MASCWVVYSEKEVVVTLFLLASERDTLRSVQSRIADIYIIIIYKTYYTGQRLI